MPFYEPSQPGAAQAGRVYRTAGSTFPNSYPLTSAGIDLMATLGSAAKGILFYGSGTFTYTSYNPIVDGEITTIPVAVGYSMNLTIAKIAGSSASTLTPNADGLYFLVIF